MLAAAANPLPIVIVQAPGVGTVNVATYRPFVPPVTSPATFRPADDATTDPDKPDRSCDSAPCWRTTYSSRTGVPAISDSGRSETVITAQPPSRVAAAVSRSIATAPTRSSRSVTYPPRVWGRQAILNECTCWYGGRGDRAVRGRIGTASYPVSPPQEDPMQPNRLTVVAVMLGAAALQQRRHGDRRISDGLGGRQRGHHLGRGCGPPPTAWRKTSMS